MTTNSSERPYKPSVIDRFTDWVENLPVPAWASYTLVGIVLLLIQILFLWLEGGLQAQELLPVIIFNSIATPLLLALIWLLDAQAATALAAMRSALDMTEPVYDDYSYRLSNMPFPAALITGTTLLVFLIVMEQVSAVPSRYAALDSLPVFTWVYQIIDKSSAFMYGVMTYHTIRQLRLVRTINSSHLRISLFDAGPSQAFSRLTATTAVGLMTGIVAWMSLNPDLLASPASVAFTVGFTLLAVAVFVWPLLGAHRLMDSEKARLLRELNARFETVLAEFNRCIREQDYEAADQLNGMITSLDIQHRRISTIPTWPWKPETARIALTAIALPLMLMILQYFVLQALKR